MTTLASAVLRRIFPSAARDGIPNRRAARRPRRVRPPSLEVLEGRALLVGISWANGIVTIQGTVGADVATVSYITGPGGAVSASPTQWLRVNFDSAVVDESEEFATATVAEIRSYGEDGNDLFQNNTWIRSLAEGGLGQDLLNGGSGSDSLNGGGGQDTINGNGGNDVLAGGDGDDLLIGGQGYDFIDGGAGADHLLGGTEDDHLIGGTGDDTLQGGAGHDILEGRDGNDRLEGESGRDILIGGLGRDTLRGGSGEDLLLGNNINFPNNHLALNAIWAEWTSTRPYSSRVLNIRGVANPTFGQRANGGYFLQPGTVVDDGALDDLDGETDRDWYLCGPFDVAAVMIGEEHTLI